MSNIFVVGSFVVDFTIRVPRMPILGEGLIGDVFYNGVGGKSTNQAIAARRLGAQVGLLACVGDDMLSQMALECYEQKNISLKHIHPIPKVNTGVSMIFITIAILFNFAAYGREENVVNNVLNDTYIELDNTRTTYEVRGNWVFEEVYSDDSETTSTFLFEGEETAGTVTNGVSYEGTYNLDSTLSIIPKTGDLKYGGYMVLNKWTDIFEDNHFRTISKLSKEPCRLSEDEQLMIRDFGSIPHDRENWLLRPYTIDNDIEGVAIWGKEDSQIVTVNPNLIGEYAIFVTVNRPPYGGEIKIKLSQDKGWIPINLQKREGICPNPEKEKPYYFGENGIEIEFYIKIATLDNEKIEILLEKGACVTALRFVPINQSQLDDYFSDMTDQKTKKVIINFETYNEIIPHLEERFEQWTLSDVGTVHMEFGVCSGYLLYPDSKYLEPWGANIPDDMLPYLKPAYRSSLETFRNLLAKGKTPLEVATASAKKTGIKVMGSMRMDLFWGDGNEPDKWRKNSLDDYPLMFNGSFYKKNPNLRIPGRNQLDYFQPKVREHFFNVFCEAAEKFDFDGMVMDFTRWPPFIREEASPKIMLNFIKEMRTRLDNIGKKKGKRLGLSAEFVDGMYSGLTLKEQCIDIKELIKSHTLDYIVIESLQIPKYDIYNSKLEYTIKDYIDMGDKFGTPIYPRNDTNFDLGLQKEVCSSATPCNHCDFEHDPYWGDELEDDPKANIPLWCGPLHYQMGVQKYYEMGADCVLLANRWQAELGLRRLGHIEELRKLNAKNKVFGQTKGENIQWKEKVETSLSLLEPHTFHNGKAEGILRLIILNTGKMFSKGHGILKIRQKEININYMLEPGESLVKDFPIIIFQTGFYARVKSDAITLESSELKYRPESWPMKLCKDPINLEDVQKSLTDMNYQVLDWYGKEVAKIKLGQSAKNILLFAKVYENKNNSQSSILNMHIGGKFTEKHHIAFNPNEKKDVFYEIEKTDFGHIVKGIIPKKDVGVSQEKDSFEVEFILEGNASDFGIWKVALFGSHNSSAKQSMEVTIEE